MRALLALFLLLALPVQAAVSVTARGTGGNNSAGTSIAVVPSGTMAAGSMGVLMLGNDNAGSGGATPATPSSFTDSVGNTWTRRINPIYDPAGANAGVETAYYTATLTTAVTTSDNITLTVTSLTAKAWALWEVVPTSNAFTMSYITGAAGTGAASATPTVTTGSITSGDVVIGGGGAEATNTWAGDGDSSNGSWSTQQTTGFGTGTTGMAVTSQYKVVTGTATQTYNPTLTSADQILGWIQLREIPAATGSFFQLF
jgi:hypothetical protein